MTCDAQGLIGRNMFAIDGVKLPSNASKERSGTHEELRHRADRLEPAADKIMAAHQAQDKRGTGAALEPKRQARIEELRKEAARTRGFLASNAPRTNRKGQELKTNVTDPDSAKMATSKGVIQGYAAQAAVDSSHQIIVAIVAADVIGSGSEQAMLLPMIAQSTPYREDHTLITADAGYHSDANIQHLKDHNIPALIADNQMRKRDERFAEQGKHKNKPDPLYDKSASRAGKPVRRFGPKDFGFSDNNTAICPAGQLMTSPGSIYTTAAGLHYQRYTAKAAVCNACPLSGKCLRGPIAPNDGRGRQISRFVRDLQNPVTPGDRMRHAIGSVRGRRLYSQRMGTVEPVFANIRHNKRLARLNHRGRTKVNTQWNLYCMGHNIEKLAKTNLGRRLN